MSFDKSKPLHIVVDNGISNDANYIYLTPDDDWSIDNIGLWYHSETRHGLIPWTSIIEIWQLYINESAGKTDGT